MSWSKICRSKGKGGMGFRDLHDFNQAMLAKVSWRIVKNPDSLLAKVLRGRYFKDGDFIKAKIGNNSSLTWRNILWGRSLFIKGIRWKIGNGNRITIDEDPWLVDGGRKVPLSVKDEFKGKRIGALLNEGGGWNVELIKEVFNPDEASAIVSILILLFGIKSLRVSSRLGVLITFASNLCNKEEASGADDSKVRKLWNAIWNINCIPRAKITIWKIISNSLPTKVNLAKRGMNTNMFCLFCRSIGESMEHVFWNCKFVRKL